MPRYWTEERILEAFSLWEKEHGRLPTSDEWKKTYSGPGRRSNAHPTSRHVATVFGTWRNAIAAQTAKKKRWKIWTEEEIIEAFQRWAEEEGTPPTYKQLSRASNGRLPSLTSVNSRFGGYRETMAAAGYEPLPKGLTYKGLNRFKPLPRRG